ncbi:MAG: hypothetical protein R2865_11300 [Deinococcales bacterium]
MSMILTSVGTHFRYGFVVPLSDWMEGEGADVTMPTLDVDDFIGKSYHCPDGKLHQLPDQQFANLYWFRFMIGLATPTFSSNLKTSMAMTLVCL